MFFQWQMIFFFRWVSYTSNLKKNFNHRIYGTLLWYIELWFWEKSNIVRSCIRHLCDFAWLFHATFVILRKFGVPKNINRLTLTMEVKLWVDLVLVFMRSTCLLSWITTVSRHKLISIFLWRKFWWYVKELIVAHS